MLLQHYFLYLCLLLPAINGFSSNLASKTEDPTKNTLNLTGFDLMEQKMGSRKQSLLFTALMSATYIFIFICGFLGNLSTCAVIITNSCMHNATNYYLFSLAISDLLSLTLGKFFVPKFFKKKLISNLGLPPELHSLIIGQYPWPFGQVFCKIRTFFFETTTIASVLIILAFTFERWLHICKPMYAQKFSNSFSRVFKIILTLWALSGLLAIPYAIGTGTELLLPEIEESKLCKPLNQYESLMTSILLLSSVLFFIFPMILISIM